MTVSDLAPATGPMQTLRLPAGAAAVSVCASTAATVGGAVLSVNLVATDGLAAGLLSVSLAATLAAAVAVMCWLHRAWTNLASLPDVRRRWSPGWAVGAWFIPVANAVLPALVFHHAAYRSVPPRERGARRTMTLLVVVWWVTFIGSETVGATGDLGATTLHRLLGCLRTAAALTLVALLALVTRHQERRFAPTATRFDATDRPPIPVRRPPVESGA
jgi:hypothetical protein